MAALERVPHLEVAGMHLMLGDGYGVDRLGNVWLDAKDSALQWAGCVHLLPTRRLVAAAHPALVQLFERHTCVTLACGSVPTC